MSMLLVMCTGIHIQVGFSGIQKAVLPTIDNRDKKKCVKNLSTS
jgi:nickel-dependent lactate racemase